MFAASFYTEIGFATKLNYSAFVEHHPKESKELQELIDRHYIRMKKECKEFVKAHQAMIHLVEEKRKEDYQKAKRINEEYKKQEQKKNWLSEFVRRDAASRVSNNSISGLTQNDPINIETHELEHAMAVMKIKHADAIDELRGYVLFLESKCIELGTQVFELEKVNYAVNYENRKLKKQLNEEVHVSKRSRSHSSSDEE